MKGRAPIFFKDFIYFILERGERWEKERERNIYEWLPLARSPLGPGRQPRPVLNPLSHTHQGQNGYFQAAFLRSNVYPSHPCVLMEFIECAQLHDLHRLVVEHRGPASFSVKSKSRCGTAGLLPWVPWARLCVNTTAWDQRHRKRTQETMPKATGRLVVTCPFLQSSVAPHAAPSRACTHTTSL